MIIIVTVEFWGGAVDDEWSMTVPDSLSSDEIGGLVREAVLQSSLYDDAPEITAYSWERMTPPAPLDGPGPARPLDT